MYIIPSTIEFNLCIFENRISDADMLLAFVEQFMRNSDQKLIESLILLPSLLRSCFAELSLCVCKIFFEFVNYSDDNLDAT